MQQQVSSYLLQGWSSRSSARRTLHQLEEEHGKTHQETVPPREGQQGGRLLCPYHFSLNRRTAPKHRPCSGPSTTCKGTVHSSGSGSLLMSVIPDWETNQSDPFYIFLESTFKKTFGLVMYQSHTFRGRDTPVKFLGSRPCQKS